jgi:hypothetical protein
MRYPPICGTLAFVAQIDLYAQNETICDGSLWPFHWLASGLLMQRLGVQVQAPWPRHGVSLCINLYLCEKLRVVQGLEHGASSGRVGQVNIPGEPVIEGNSQYAVLRDAHLGHPGNPPTHVLMVTPQDVRRG